MEELINRRRRQLLVHSVIYYRFDENLISDATWSRWAMELVELQKKHPDIASNCVYADDFKNFDGSTGFDLPLGDIWANSKARKLLIMSGKATYEDFAR